MERRDRISEALRGQTPGAVGSPEELRTRIDRALGDSQPGRERVAKGPSRAPAAVAALALAIAGAGVWLGWSPAPATPVATPIAEVSTPEPIMGVGSLRMVSWDRPDPLTREARQIVEDLKRFRASVERPVRSMASVGKSL